ncbi:MAG TPA: hypothetical protein VNR67_01570 [Solirubrobacterales bacterium]|nr:hypothetical protein [Solirubrobacterales bacterium]
MLGAELDFAVALARAFGFAGFALPRFGADRLFGLDFGFDRALGFVFV